MFSSEKSDACGVVEVLPTGVLPMLAVIPFSFVGVSNNQLAVIGEILANHVIGLLWKSQHLKVISRLSTTKFRDQQWTCGTIKSRLNCDYVLHGFYSEHADMLRVSFSLHETRTRKNIFTDEFICSVRDILDAESSPVRDLAVNTERTILNSVVSLTSVESLSSLENHALYINGINYMHSETDDQFMLSRDCLLALVERQPQLSSVNAAISLWHLLSVQRTGGWHLREQVDFEKKIRHYIDKALVLNPGNEFALALKGTVEVQISKNKELGLDYARSALSTNQNDPRVFLFCSLVFVSARSYKEASICIDKAIALSPLDPQMEFFCAAAAAASYHLDDFVLAKHFCSRSIKLNPNHTSPWRTLIATQVAMGETDEARASAVKLMNIEPGFTIDSWLRRWSGDRQDGELFASYLEAAGCRKSGS